jgi:hypothetical protein
MERIKKLRLVNHTIGGIVCFGAGVVDGSLKSPHLGLKVMQVALPLVNAGVQAVLEARLQDSYTLTAFSPDAKHSSAIAYALIGGGIGGVSYNIGKYFGSLL